MPKNNYSDLLQGYTIGKKTMPIVDPIRALDENNEVVDNSDLFAGYEIGGSFVPPVAKPQELQAEPAQIPKTEDLTVVKGAQSAWDAVTGAVSDFVGDAATAAGSYVPDFISGADRESRATRDLPELASSGILSGEDIGTGLKLAPILAVTYEPKEIADIITSNFKNIGVSRDPEGNIILGNNKTGAKAVINKPGLSGLDWLQAGATMAAFTPAAGVVGGGAAQATKGLVAKRMAQGGLGAAVTETAIQTAQEATGGDFSGGDVALSGVLGGVGEAIVPAIQGFRQGRAAKKVGAESAEIEEVKRAIRPAQDAMAGLKEATGQEVGLFKAQQTALPAEVLKQRILPQLDAGAKVAAKRLETQNKEAFNATAALIDTIASPRVVATGEKRFRSAAQAAIEAKRQFRTAKTKDLYKDAFEAGADVDLKPVNAIIDKILKDAPPGGQYEAVGKKMSNLVSRKEGAPSLQQLQKAKTEIFEIGAEKEINPMLRREVMEVFKTLQGKMGEASQSYKAADAEFSRLSPAVDDLVDSVIGQIADVKSKNLKDIAGKLFNPKEVNPTVLKDAKKLINEVDPGAWDDLLRVEFQRRFGALQEIMDGAGSGAVGNAPGQLRRALFGPMNSEKRRVILSAMNKDQTKNFRYLDEVLRRAEIGRGTGSHTTPAKEFIDKLKGVAGVIFSPIQSTKEAGGQILFDRKVAALTDVMFNPKWKPRMDQLRKISPDSPSAGRAMIQLLKMAEEDE